MGFGDKHIDIFISHIRHECRRYRMRFVLSTDKCLLIDDNEVGGYFSENPLTIAISTGDLAVADWIGTLVHEFSHFEQWRDHDPSYVTTYKRTTADKIVELWMHGKDYDDKTIDDCLNQQKLCELNCERRTVKNLIKFNIPIDIDLYTQNANAYIHYYNYMKLTRRWTTPNKNFPTDIPEILKSMPKHLNMNYKTMTKKMMALYDKHLGYMDA